MAAVAPLKKILLIVGGGIAAYKSLELVRLLRKAGYQVTALLTEAGAKFVTALSLQALTENKVYGDLWSLTDESEMGHIQLSRAADLIVVAPATANLLARMAAGLADDLAATVLLATDKPVLVAPAMNVSMWRHKATEANVATLRARGVRFVGPDEGEMACHEWGPGRLAEPEAIFAAIEAFFAPGPLAGVRALVTAGPTFEALDPVRFIGNRSSGRQGYAIAEALAHLSAEVTLVSGPVALAPPPSVLTVPVESAGEMLAACEAALPVDVAVFCAAVADWRAETVSATKLKKNVTAPTLRLTQTADILATIAAPGPKRPRLVIGFAAETDDVARHAAEKRLRKNADWILGNDVRPETEIMGGARNSVIVTRASGIEAWPDMPKQAVAARLADEIAAALGTAR